MLRSRLSSLARNFTLKRQPLAFNKKFTYSPKIAVASLAALTMMLTPKYINMKEESPQ